MRGGGARAAWALGSFALAGSAASLALAVTEPAEPAAGSVSVAGTDLRVAGPDGSVRRAEALVGAVLAIRDASGRRREVRVDGVHRDEKDPDGEILLYELSIRDGEGEPWRNLCRPGPDGRALGFPLATPGTPGLRLTCTSGAVAKCVRWGYKPWRRARDGSSLAPVHAACVRMARADYCGDGTPHTRDGTLVDVYDTFGVRRPTAGAPPGMTFEAAWGPDGAVCVRRVRIAEVTSIEALVEACPARLAGRVGEDCTEAAALRGGALVLNRSNRSGGSR